MIQPKKKTCDGECGQLAYIWKNEGGKKYCKECYHKHKNRCVQDKAYTKPTKKQYRIPPKSSKKAKLDAAYSILREHYLKAKPLCEAHIPGLCTNLSIEIHHAKGRGIYQNDTTTWKAVCRPCHDYIENHPEEAKDLELSVSRLNK